MIYVTDIVWDTDGVSIDDLPEEVMIDPKEIRSEERRVGAFCSQIK